MKGYPAVSIVGSSQCCRAAKLLHGVRLLAVEAPRLPLPDCSTPGECRCHFQKHPDRRSGDEDRRSLMTATRSVWYSGAERRRDRPRRKDD